jgi:hypothetical protein
MKVIGSIIDHGDPYNNVCAFEWSTPRFGDTPTQVLTIDLATKHPNGWSNGKIHIGEVHI